jgi:hypothetical protein
MPQLLNLHSFLPYSSIVDTTEDHNNNQGREVCDSPAAGEMLLFGKAEIDFDDLADLNAHGVW